MNYACNTREGCTQSIIKVAEKQRNPGLESSVEALIVAQNLTK